MLTRSFLEFSIWGWDNLPRTLFMYYTNVMSSPEGYFHTVICNHKDYQNTTVNHDLHYVRWDNPPKRHPVNLTLEHFKDILQSGAPFAREFAKDDPVLDKIDKELLRRPYGRFTPGGWCVGGNSGLDKDSCEVHGSPYAVKPSANSKRLEKLILKLLDYDVKVAVEDGRTFIADTAIVTNSLGVLKSNSITFEPRVLEWKEAAIEDLGVGIENKIILHFENVFLGVVAETFYECSYFLNLHKATGHSGLVYMPAGLLVRDIEKMSDEASANFAFIQLKKILPTLPLQ
ncbi:hypothetical protein U1Q18_013334 [Sarracenia purpurea var. burkii]